MGHDRLDALSGQSSSDAYDQLRAELKVVAKENERARSLMFWGIKFLPLVVAAELLCWVIEFAELDSRLELSMLGALGAVWLLALVITWGPRQPAGKPTTRQSQDELSP